MSDYRPVYTPTPAEEAHARAAARVFWQEKPPSQAENLITGVAQFAFNAVMWFGMFCWVIFALALAAYYPLVGLPLLAWMVYQVYKQVKRNRAQKQLATTKHRAAI